MTMSLEFRAGVNDPLRVAIARVAELGIKCANQRETLRIYEGKIQSLKGSLREAHAYLREMEDELAEHDDQKA